MMRRVWPFLLCLAAWVQLAGCAGDGAADSPPLAGGRQATIPDEVRLELVRLGVEDLAMKGSMPRDEVGLDERRKAVGLPTMEEYMRLMEEFTKIPVVR